ncbi:MAG: hypothetical protein JW809_18250 [Pirellulales bacterium]|nr:hypothetical protein [Pirellulales bacterium]
MKRRITFAVLALVLVAGTSLGAIVTLDDVTIKYKIPCEAALKQFNLGDIRITTHNKGADELDNDKDGTVDEADEKDFWMDAVFSVDANAEKSCIWNCMKLHWVQTIWHDDAPAKYGGVDPTLPIIDPPSGGWDYQNDNDRDGMDNDRDGTVDEADEATDADSRDNDGDGVVDEPNESGDDNQPWYWNAAEEIVYNTLHKEYRFNDNPFDTVAPGFTGFSTYLVAVATATCPLQLAECLDLDEILVLAGFDWTINTAEIKVTDTFKAPSPFDVADITAALANAGLTGWTVRDGKAICCIPEPSTFVIWSLLCLSGVIAAPVRRRNALSRE